MSELIFEKECGTCSGVGTNPVRGGPCESCGGDGKIYWGNADALMDKLNTMGAKLDGLISRLTDMEERVGANITIDAWGYSSVTQGSFTRVTDSEFYQGKYLTSDDGIDGDQVNFRVFMVAGTYTLNVIHSKSFLMGIMKVLIDDSEVASTDCYADPTEIIVTTSTYDIVVSSTGFKTISFKVDGKNPSADDYYLLFSAFFINKTA